MFGGRDARSEWVAHISVLDRAVHLILLAETTKYYTNK
jgi:hypothetical protein